MYQIVLIKIDRRANEAAKVQSILTEYGCNIKVRLGLHEVSKDICANDGLIILEVEGDVSEMLTKLNDIQDVKAKIIEI